MRLWRHLSAFLGLVLAAASLGAADAGGSSWDAMKTLVGEWSGTAEGRPVSVSYRLVSNGTALMENLNGGHDADMITMYTPDGAVLLATHYCSAGNQPRMRAKASNGGKSIDFQFVDAANVTDASEVMQRLVVTFVDAKHFDQQWTSRGKDGREHTSLFRYTRRN